MEIWVELARLGAAIAAFGPPVLTGADEEANQVDMPTLGVGEQPTANLVLDITGVRNDNVRDVDENARPDPTLFSDPYTAAVPQQSVMPQPPDTKLTGKSRKFGVTPSMKGIVGGRSRSRGWHGGGQRYPAE
jgi:hypothetical protein